MGINGLPDGHHPRLISNVRTIDILLVFMRSYVCTMELNCLCVHIHYVRTYYSKVTYMRGIQPVVSYRQVAKLCTVKQ